MSPSKFLNIFHFRNRQRFTYLACASAFGLVYSYLIIMSWESPPAKNKHAGKRAYEYIPTTDYAINTSTCKIPDFDPWHESTRLISEKCEGEDGIEPRCREKEARDWLYSQGSNLIVNYSAIHEHGYSWNMLRCCYRAIERVEQTLEKYDMKADLRVRLSKTCYEIKNGSNHVPHEFIKAFCISTSIPLFEDVVYREYFAFARLDAHAEEKVSKWMGIPHSERPPNIIILGIDTNSRLNSRRQFHKSLKILRELGAVEMFGYTKVGENTFPNTIPMFVGISEEEMMPYCYSSPADAQDDCPYIWKDFDRAGYLTATIDDSPLSTSFNYMKTGFVFKPTDFYYRPFTLGVMNQPRESSWHVKCIGHQRNDEVQLNYISDVLQTALPLAPVFIHSWFTTFTHGCINNAGFLDPPVADFIQKNIEPLQNSIFLFMSDHGDRYGSFRETTLGWYEDKLPTMWVYMTPDLKRKFPSWDEAIHINSRRLTSHYDLYHTMTQIMGEFNKNQNFDESFEAENKPVPMRKGQSLLEPVPENRTCHDAGIPQSYCACTEPQILNVKSGSPSVLETLNKIATVVLKYLKGFLPPVCATPILKEIVSGKYLNEIGGNAANSSKTYILSMYTDPGDFLFEATVKASMNPEGKEEYKVESLTDILRMNKMSRKVDCVHNPDLERYCYCL